MRNRVNAMGRPGFVYSVPPGPQPDNGTYGSWEASKRYLFGTGEEAVQYRIPAAKYATDPDTHSPAFRPIAPGPSSQNANEPRPRQYTPGGSRNPSTRMY